MCITVLLPDRNIWRGGGCVDVYITSRGLGIRKFEDPGLGSTCFNHVLHKAAKSIEEDDLVRCEAVCSGRGCRFLHAAC
jgi:hypothetical protein